MTNAEKFKEVFGFELNTRPFKYHCIAQHNLEVCREHYECGSCPYDTWEKTRIR